MIRLSACPPVRLSAALIAALLFLAGASCVPAKEPPPPPVDRDGLTTDLGQVCIALRAAGCPEGEPVSPQKTCYEHLVRVSERVEIPTSCLIMSKTKVLIRGCGTPQTLRFRCDPQIR